MPSFPTDFLWGTASSAFQIEGDRAGRGASIWDTFCRIPGAVRNGDTGDVACDHVNRYRDDIGLMKRLGVGAYRFSTAWPRIQPDGKGRPVEDGLAFYDRVTDAVLEAGIEPWVCLHHWDLPQALEDKGGWRNRDTAHRFADFAEIVGRRLGDRVPVFSPINEPNVIVYVGYGFGGHAPGKRSRADAIAAIHHVNLAYGQAMTVWRDVLPTAARLGPIISMAPVVPAREDEEHAQAAEIVDWLWRRVMTDPVMTGAYPALYADEIARHIEPGDLEQIGQKIDFFGLNHYSKIYAKPDPDHIFGIGEADPPSGAPVTAMGWEIDPDTIPRQLADMTERYGDLPPIYITENGAAFDDKPVPDGRVEDTDRIAFFEGYLSAVASAIEAGYDIRGYFVWSLLDNFEWGLGYSKRFGIVRVDYDTQARTPKASFDRLAAIIAENRV